MNGAIRKHCAAIGADEAPSPEIDPALINAWLSGWAMARGAPPPVPIAGGFRVDTGTSVERVRYLLLTPDADTIRPIVETETAPGAAIKICAEAEKITSLLTSAWRLHGPQHVMTVALDAVASPRAPRPPLPITSKITGPICSTGIMDDAKRKISSGRLILLDRFAVIDDISTEPGFRRQGLATALVVELMEIGRREGAKTGVLVATAAGQKIYANLGWQVYAPYTSAYTG
jgi:hypothetical protein